MRLGRRLFQLLSLGAVAGLTGCGSSDKSLAGPTSAPTPQETWVTRPLPAPPTQIRPVAEGPAPLAFLVESSIFARVVDMTSNQELVSMTVPGRTIIAVSQNAGVTVGGVAIKRGPLPDDHRYAIYLGSNEENVIRTGTIRPGTPVRQEPAQLAPATAPSP